MFILLQNNSLIRIDNILSITEIEHYENQCAEYFKFHIRTSEIDFEELQDGVAQFNVCYTQIYKDYKDAKKAYLNLLRHINGYNDKRESLVLKGIDEFYINVDDILED